MLLSPVKLILLRIFNITLGRFFFCSKILKKFLVRILIKNTESKYVASSKYFDWRDLNE